MNIHLDLDVRRRMAQRPPNPIMHHPIIISTQRQLLHPKSPKAMRDTLEEMHIGRHTILRQHIRIQQCLVPQGIQPGDSKRGRRESVNFFG